MIETKSDQIRSFIAIELPTQVKAELKILQQAWKGANSGIVKWVNPDGIHITLKFLGNIDLKQVDKITEIIKLSCQKIQPFTLQLQGTGAFPNLRRVQVVWIGVIGELPALQELFSNIEANLSKIGFPAEGRGFVPHITLARVRENASMSERQALGELINRTKIEKSLNIEVKSINLMRSDLTRTGARYTLLGSVELKPSCQ